MTPSRSLTCGYVARMPRWRTHRARQLEERVAIGAGYQDGELVVCLADGQPVHPKTMSHYFERQVKRLDLPRIPLHDLRHTHATLEVHP